MPLESTVGTKVTDGLLGYARASPSGETGLRHRSIGSAAPVFRRRATQCSLGRSTFQRDRLAGVKLSLNSEAKHDLSLLLSRLHR